MTSLILDPVLLTVPDDSWTVEDASKWWEVLSEWLNELSHQVFDWYVIYDCLLKLDEIGRTISYDRITEFGKRFGLVVNPRQLKPIARALASDSHDYQSKTVTNYVVSEVDLSLAPTEIVHRNDVEVLDSLRSAFGCLAVDQQLQSNLTQDLRVITLPLLGPETVITVSGNVCLIDPPELEQQLPSQEVSGQFSMIHYNNQLSDLSCRSVVELGSRSIERHIERIALDKFANTPLLDFEVGQDFEASLHDSDVFPDDIGLNKVFERCAQVLAGQLPEAANLRQVRQNESGDSGAVRRDDGGVGWRVSVTIIGIGWRMHFWRVPPSAGGNREMVVFHKVFRHSDPVRM